MICPHGWWNNNFVKIFIFSPSWKILTPIVCTTGSAFVDIIFTSFLLNNFPQVHNFPGMYRGLSSFPLSNFLKLFFFGTNSCLPKSDSSFSCWGLIIDGDNSSPGVDSLFEVHVGKMADCMTLYSGTLIIPMRVRTSFLSYSIFCMLILGIKSLSTTKEDTKSLQEVSNVWVSISPGGVNIMQRRYGYLCWRPRPYCAQRALSSM